MQFGCKVFEKIHVLSKCKTMNLPSKIRNSPTVPKCIARYSMILKTRFVSPPSDYKKVTKKLEWGASF